jgi:hypothetical protein
MEPHTFGPLVGLGSVGSMAFLFFFPTARYFLGFEHVFGDDHEATDYWSAFIKSEPSWELWFEAPAKRGEEITPFERLGPEWKLLMVRYCHARYGTEDVKQCYEHLKALD